MDTGLSLDDIGSNNNWNTLHCNATIPQWKRTFKHRV